MKEFVKEVLIENVDDVCKEIVITEKLTRTTFPDGDVLISAEHRTEYFEGGEMKEVRYLEVLVDTVKEGEILLNLLKNNPVLVHTYKFKK